MFDELIRKPAKVKSDQPVQKTDPRLYGDIKTFEDAFQRSKKHFKLNKLPDLSSVLPEELSKPLTAFMKLQMVAWAINNDNSEVPEWIPDYNNPNQRKWGVLYRQIDRNFFPVIPQFGEVYPMVGGGARLVFKDEPRSFHADKYFRDLYKKLYIIE